eukprot:10784252-Lingulodinium_polyedra.AAC.1
MPRCRLCAERGVDGAAMPGSDYCSARSALARDPVPPPGLAPGKADIGLSQDMAAVRIGALSNG